MTDTDKDRLVEALRWIASETPGYSRSLGAFEDMAPFIQRLKAKARDTLREHDAAQSQQQPEGGVIEQLHADAKRAEELRQEFFRGRPQPSRGENAELADLSRQLLLDAAFLRAQTETNDFRAERIIKAANILDDLSRSEGQLAGGENAELVERLRDGRELIDDMFCGKVPPRTQQFLADVAEAEKVLSRPVQSQLEVTEEMVEAALHGFDTGIGDPNDYRKRMYAALTAALSLKP